MTDTAVKKYIVETPDTSEFGAMVDIHRTRVLDIQIVDNATCDKAGELSKSCKTLIDRIKNVFKEPKDLAFKTHKAICHLEKQALKPAQEVATMVDGKISQWYTEQEVLRREEQRRIEAELKAKAQREALERGDVLMEKGKYEEAAKVYEDVPKAKAPPVLVPKKTAKIEGMTQRTYYKAKLIDKFTVVRAVANNELPLEAIEVNGTYFNKLADAMKDEFAAPGHTLVKETKMVRTRKAS